MENQYLIIALLVLSNVLLLVLLFFVYKQNNKKTEDTAVLLEKSLKEQNDYVALLLNQLKTELNQSNTNTMNLMSQTLQTAVGTMSTNVSQNQAAQARQVELRLANLEKSNEQKFEQIRATLQSNMDAMRAENTKKLEQIRHTVEEQLQDTLQKRISESFQSVTTQLEQVYKGLGEMQTLASDVGGLKQVLSGVKTRGILGEIQLGAILSEILAPEQYAVNINTIPNSKNRVEFAIRLPGTGQDSVWLPIDSKFPGDTFAHLQDALQSGDVAAAELARKALIQVICTEAKDIRDKYVEPPYTTNFGVLFLPFEGLYAEVVNLGLLERLQRDYQINVAGPSTMAALLNSLQMGFKTLAIQKRSSEVWTVLGAVKSEFDKFGTGLAKMQERMRQTDEEMEKLIGTRTKAIQRKLRGVQALDGIESAQLLEIEE